MKKAWAWCPGLVLSMALAGAAMGAQEEGKSSPFAELDWQRGPASFTLGNRATIRLPERSAALSESESSKFLKLTGNLPSPGLNIIVGNNWWATFEFDESGYIKDGDEIDADALLKQLKAQDEPSNEARRRQGLSELHTDGWYVAPHYDKSTRHLEWGLRLHASDDPAPVINYTVRLLGRHGYERVVLVSSPETLDRDVAEFKTLLGAFEFNGGEKYSEFRQGDRVAQFGLAALVAGGAAAVAAKTGFWKALLAFLAATWKLVAGAVVAALAAIGKMFGRKGRS